MEGPSLFFVLPAVLVLAALGTTLLVLANRLRVSRDSDWKGITALGLALIVVGATMVVYVGYPKSERSFTYQATLVPDAPGAVRLTLPMPDDGSLPAMLVVTPSTASITVNRSGTEPALEITITERTTISASARSLGALPSENLTRAQEVGSCFFNGNCSASVSLQILSGTTASVRVDVSATWGTSCEIQIWELRVDALPGERDYVSIWHLAVC